MLKLVQEIKKSKEKYNNVFLKSKHEAEIDKDRYTYSKKKLQDAPGKIVFTKDQATAYFKSVYSDKSRNEEYTLDSVSSYLLPEGSEGLVPPRKEAIVNILKKTRHKSAPGPNSVPYNVYKNCPILPTYLLKLYVMFWKKSILSSIFWCSHNKAVTKRKKSVMTQVKPSPNR